MAIVRSSLALLLVAAATSNGVSHAVNLRERNLASTATNVNTYTNYDEYASAMLTAVNNLRAENGLSPLCLNTKLHIAAQGHSDDMAANGYMGHVGSDGSTSSQRITQAGYKNWTAVAENVAKNQMDVDAVMVAWRDSPGHFENIVGDYTMFGSAYSFSQNGPYQHYWTQNFAKGDAEVCDGAPSSDLTPSPYGTQNVDQAPVVTEATPDTTTVTADVVTEAPVVTEATPDTTTVTADIVTEAPPTGPPTTYPSVTFSSAPLTPTIDIVNVKNCKPKPK